MTFQDFPLWAQLSIIVGLWGVFMLALSLVMLILDAIPPLYRFFGNALGGTVRWEDDDA